MLQSSFPVTYTIRDTICAGTCSEVPGFDSPCISGLYIRTLPAVAPDVCDTTIRLQLTVLNPVAEITATATTLDCTIHSIVLSSGPSSNGLKTWKNLNTGATSFASNYTITTPDTYVLTCQKGSGELLCTAYDTIQITSEPNQIALSVPDVVLPCGQTTTHFLAQATGAGLVYNWTGPGGFTGTTNHPLVSVPGTYHVTVSNQQGCQGTATAHLVAETPPFSVAATTDSITCGHPATLFAVTNAFSPFFHWSGPGMESFLPNPQVSTPATYAVTVSSPSTLCTATAQVNVVSLQVYPFLHLVQRIHPTVGQNNGSIEMSTGGAPGPFAFSWIKDGQVVATTEDIYGVGAGVYSYQVQAANGCSKTALFTLLNSLPNDDEFNSQSWELAPNPSSGFFNLRWKVGAPAGTHLRVYAGSGRLLQEWNVPEGAETLDIDLSNAPAGLYFLEMRNGAERAWQKMVVR
ncbi:MAG: T9SS type A sorting domain-containing protein [Bacteroidetes bacterium]|nr:T9SS type A sorting domain-containing protein [Bacteroidota bacterium]